jgi:RNA polymerase sigma-70 factor (ECF subfamily)
VTPQRDIDAQLVERVQAGEQRAFELLVSKYERRVLRLIGRLIRDPAEAEDVAQEAFIKAYRAIPQFRGESAFYTWLYRIAVNTAKNHLATQKRRPRPVGDFHSDEDGESFNPEDVVEDINTPDALLHSRQVAEAVNAAIEALPEDLRSAITLREIEGLSYEEIAQAMDCPIGTVRSRIFRARDAIAEQLRPLLGTVGGRRW